MTDIQDLRSYSLPERPCFTDQFRFILWYLTGRLLVSCFLPGTFWRKSILRLFGAQIGCGGRIKPSVLITCPWLLSVGDYCWIGEKVWIDNLAPVAVGNNVCLSQGSYLCTGNHDYRKSTFDLKLQSISVGSHSWIAASSVLGPGTQVGAGTVVCLGSVATGVIPPGSILQGNPASVVGKR